MSSFKAVYLIAYNLACACGWAYVLLRSVGNTLAGHSQQHLYDDVEQVLLIVQTAALLEVVHSLTGVVRSPWMTTLMQVGSRLVGLWAFLWAIPETQSQIGAVLCITSWAAVEVPRYLFYAFNIMGGVPYPLFYLRYSLFFILYPTGITGEVLTMWHALPTLKDSQEHLRIDIGPLHVSAYMLAIIVLLVYVPGGPFMYQNMISTRRSAFKKRRLEYESKAKIS